MSLAGTQLRALGIQSSLALAWLSFLDGEGKHPYFSLPEKLLRMIHLTEIF